MDPDLTPPRVAELLEHDEIELVDVRQSAERDAGRIAGDTHVELNVLGERAESLPRDRPIVFYCRSGARSAMAAEAFRGAGFDAHNMVGGLLEWVAAGLPLDPADGYVA